MRGKQISFPCVLKRIEGLGYKDYEVSSLDELIEMISSVLNNEDSKDKLVEVCGKIGLYDTVNLIDRRTMQLISLFKFYKSAPHNIDNMIFFDTVNILSDYEMRLY